MIIKYFLVLFAISGSAGKFNVCIGAPQIETPGSGSDIERNDALRFCYNDITKNEFCKLKNFDKSLKTLICYNFVNL